MIRKFVVLKKGDVVTCKEFEHGNDKLYDCSLRSGRKDSHLGGFSSFDIRDVDDLRLNHDGVDIWMKVASNQTCLVEEVGRGREFVIDCSRSRSKLG